MNTYRYGTKAIFEGRIYDANDPSLPAAARLLDRYSDEALQADVDEGGTGTRGGLHPRQAAALLLAPFEVRAQIMDEAHTRTNYIGGNLSGAIHSATSEFARSGQFPYTGRAQAHCRAEKAANEAARAVQPGAPYIILPMN